MAVIKWSMEKLQSAADQFTNRTEFARGNPAAYSTAARRKVLDQICGHMVAKQAARYTDDQLRETAARYQHASDFSDEHPSQYQAACSRGIIKDICLHMTRKPVSFPNRAPPALKWSIEKLSEAAQPYTSRGDFRKNQPRAYDAAYTKGLLDEICEHMTVCRPSKLTNEIYLASLPDEIEVLEPVVNATTKILHRCKQCSHEWSSQPAWVRSGKGCPRCGIERGRKSQALSKRYTYEEYASKAERFDVLEPYQGIGVKILHRCKQCLHEWSVKPSLILLGHGCPRRCTPVADYQQQLKSVFGDTITLTGEWFNTSVKTKHVCNKGHEFEVLPKDMLRMLGCRRCNSNGLSTIEVEMADWIASLGVEIKRSDRSIIAPKELDIFIPAHDLAVEFNGTYWHSTKEPDYHLNKTLGCAEKGIRLIHVWEHEGRNPIMRSIIATALGRADETIWARKCNVEYVPWADASAFLNTNHIQGAGAPSPYNVALTHDGEIVAVMTFAKPRFKPIEHDWELVRYAVKCNTRVNGGASRLWSRRPTGSIITYSDRRLFDGSLYERLGFEQQRSSAPGYFYVNVAGAVLRRWDTRREKLPALLGDRFDPALSEAKNMVAAGYTRIWDCGTVAWSYRPT